jgi:hypothetical protein
MSKVVFKIADGRVMAADTVPGKESARFSWLVAIRHIILRVLPNPYHLPVGHRGSWQEHHLYHICQRYSYNY